MSTKIKRVFKAIPVVRNVAVFCIFLKNVKRTHSITPLLVDFALSKVEHCIIPPNFVVSPKVVIKHPLLALLPFHIGAMKT